MANFMGVLAARRAALGEAVRRSGVAAADRRLIAYASAAAHGSLDRAMDLCGLGSASLRRVPVNRMHQIDTAALRQAIAADRAAGFTPFFIAGTAGTVDAGAIDDLATLAEIARCEGAWFHVDGACGALAILAPDLAPRLAGIECADSLAFDFHKWGQVPYDAGFILMRDRKRLEETFASPAAYLRREERGMAAGAPWPCDLGPDLSRGFSALKVWYTLQVYGSERLGQMISGCCALARYLARRIAGTAALELAAPVGLNIVCFRYRCEDAERVNAGIAIALQESGIAATSTTVIDGRLALRAAIVNHRTTARDVDALLDAVLALGAARGVPA
jgi:glutamate/tyrosine decarboxylase-like PLP-dependent enzyme